jgi:hypothetical protein
MVILIVMNKEKLYPLIGVEEVLRRESSWKEEITEISDIVTEKNPYVYCLDECLHKVYTLKSRLEQMNSKLLVSIPILCIAVTRAEFDPLPSHLNTLFKENSGIGLYFSAAVTELLELIFYSGEQYKPIPVKTKDVACIFDKRDFSFSRSSDQQHITAKDTICCYMLFSTKEELLSAVDLIRSWPGSPLICHDNHLNELMLLSVWNELPFKFVVRMNVSSYITRVGNLLLVSTKEDQFEPSYSSEYEYVFELLQNKDSTILVHPLALPYCRGISKYYDGFESYGVLLSYNTGKEAFSPCDHACILERLSTIEKVVSKI